MRLQASSTQAKNNLLAYIAGGILFACFFINIKTSVTNNYHIALLSLVFPFTFYCLTKLRPSKTQQLLLLAPIMSISISCIVSPLTSHWPRHFAIISSLVLAVSLYSWLIQSSTRHIIGVLKSISLATITYFLVWLLFWYNLDDPYVHDWLTHTPFFRNIRHLGYLLVASLIISCWFVLIQTNKPFFWTSLLAFTLSSFLLCWSGSRGALLATMTGLLLLFVFIPHYKKWFFLLLAFVLGAIASTFFHVQNKSLGLFSSISRTTERIGSIDKISSGRLTIYKDTLSKIIEKPIWGWGPDSFIALKIKPGFVQAHNGLLQLLLEGGLVFTTLIFGMIFYILFKAVATLFERNAIASDKKRHLLILALSLTLALLTHAMTDGIFYHGSPLTLLVFSLALTAALSLNRSASTPTGDQ